MSKTKKPKPVRPLESEIEDLDLSDFLETYSEDELNTRVIVPILEAGKQQMQLALQLTQLIVEKHSGELNEDKILTIFKKACKAAHEHFPVKSLWEELG